jgi:hypothetical protein
MKSAAAWVLVLFAAAQFSTARAASEDELNIPRAGHGLATYYDYNIWGAPAVVKDGQGNCHNAADSFLSAALKKNMTAGVLVCESESPATDSTGHTANWLILPDKKKSEPQKGLVVNSDVACLINWGDTCCWHHAEIEKGALIIDGTKNPTSLDCAMKTCGKQFTPGRTRTLASGQFVERPGPYICALHAAGGRSDIPLDDPRNKLSWDPARRGSCQACCKKRTALWDDSRGEMTQGRPRDEKEWDGRRKDFFYACNTACDHAFEYRTCRQ